MNRATEGTAGTTQITLKSKMWRSHHHEFRHSDLGPKAWVCWPNRAERSDASDHDRGVVFVSGLEGTPEQIREFLDSEDLDVWVEYADADLRKEYRLPERIELESYDSGKTYHRVLPELQVKIADDLLVVL